MNYYQHHIGDYRRDTGHLTLLEHGVYRQLLDMYYLSEEPIPKETDLVMRRLCARTEEEKRAVITVLSEFFSLESQGKGYVHKRCNSEISEYKAKADRARSNGKLGGRPPITKEVISGNQEVTKEKANHKPLTINHKPLTINHKPLTINQDKPLSAEPPPTFADGLDIAAWTKWVEYRKQIKKPLKPISMPSAQKAMAEMADMQMEAVDHTIANGWTGLFMPNKHLPQSHQSPTAGKVTTINGQPHVLPPIKAFPK